MENKMTKNIVKANGKKRKHEIKAGEIRLCAFGRTGHLVGKISGDTAYKDESARSAFLKYPERAIAHTIDALKFMQEVGAVYIDVLDTDAGIHYRTTVQKYFDEGEYFFGGVKYGEQLKLTLPNFAQVRDPEYTAHTDSEAQHYSDTDGTHDVKPLVYKSRATVGAVYGKGGKQLSLFGANNDRDQNTKRI
jgi:hypothetical protein